MRRGTRHILLSAPLLAACVLTACSGTPDTAASAEPTRTPALETYFQAVYGGGLSEEEREKRADEQIERSNELIAQCMKEQGFEYTSDAPVGESAASEEEWDPESREFVAQYGYGAVNQPGGDGAGAAAEDADPNAAYVASLSESERAAYEEALAGRQPTEDEMAALESGEQTWDWTQGGCSGKAYHEITGDDPLQSDEHKGLNDAITKFFEEQSTWPELAELNSAWSTCMTEAGHPGFTTQTDAQASIYDKQSTLRESAGPDGEPDPAALDALAEEEVELALVDLDCREKTDFRSKFDDVNFEKQQQFVDDHKAELEAVKADAEQGR
ncbi:hypothetical protein NUM3379_21600 [Kineococcus sp. NUM-3379]